MPGMGGGPRMPMGGGRAMPMGGGMGMPMQPPGGGPSAPPGGGGMPPGFNTPISPGSRGMGGAFGGNSSAGGVEQARARVWQLQEACGRGSGSACIQLKTAQQQLEMLMQQEQLDKQVQMSRIGGAGAMGTRGRGDSGMGRMRNMEAAMINAAFGPMGGGLGSSGMGGGWG